MKLQQLRYFEAACRLGSVSRAAEALRVSQPAVSMAIRELEREFGVALTVKRYQGFDLTVDGKILLEMSGSLLRHADHVSEQMCLRGRRRRPVRLGMPPMIGTVLLPVLYRALNFLEPDILLSTEELGTKRFSTIYRKIRWTWRSSPTIFLWGKISHPCPLRRWKSSGAPCRGTPWQAGRPFPSRSWRQNPWCFSTAAFPWWNCFSSSSRKPESSRIFSMPLPSSPPCRA